MPQKREIARADILTMDQYAKERTELRRNVVAVKRHRRVEVGPFATFYFENYETMWHQIHEMLFIEKGGEEQIADELRAFNPLIPKGRELVATAMFEIDDPLRRANVLARLGGIEANAFIEVAGKRVRAVAEQDVERTREDGKASSVQFLHFPFGEAEIRAFCTPGTQVIVGFDHPEYSHMAVMPEATRAALAADFA
jgi:hypothetical protein